VFFGGRGLRVLATEHQIAILLLCCDAHAFKHAGWAPRHRRVVRHTTRRCKSLLSRLLLLILSRTVLGRHSARGFEDLDRAALDDLLDCEADNAAADLHGLCLVNLELNRLL